MRRCWAHYADAGVIAAVVLVNAIVGVVQEGRAEQALSALRSMLAPTARVLRGGHRATVPVADLVPGDVLLLEAGDRVPADARLLRARGLRVDESVLTGESVPVDKQVDPVAPDAELAARTSMLPFRHPGGDRPGGGGGHRSAQPDRPDRCAAGRDRTAGNPLLRQIRRFGRGFTVAALVAAVALFLFALAVRGYAWLDADGGGGARGGRGPGKPARGHHHHPGPGRAPQWPRATPSSGAAAVGTLGATP